MRRPKLTDALNEYQLLVLENQNKLSHAKRMAAGTSWELDGQAARHNWFVYTSVAVVRCETPNVIHVMFTLSCKAVVQPLEDAAKIIAPRNYSITALYRIAQNFERNLEHQTLDCIPPGSCHILSQSWQPN